MPPSPPLATGFRGTFRSGFRIPAVEEWYDVRRDPAEAKWNVWYARFLSWPPDLRGKRVVPVTYVNDNGYRLGQWQSQQRQHYKRGELSKSRIERLNAAGFVWSTHDAAWEEAFAHFKKLQPDARGKRHVDDKYETASGFGLGAWLQKMRREQNEGELDAELVARLDGAGMVWGSKHSDSWEDAFLHFRVFPRDEKGRRPVPRQHVTPDGFKLGSWVHNQRQQYKRGELDPDRLVKLESAGIVWDLWDHVWEEGFEHFLEFPPDEQGFRHVPQSYVSADGYRLGQWQKNQRTAYKTGLLSESRQQRLREVGMELDLTEAAWVEGFELFESLPQDARGKRSIAQQYVADDGFRLGRWVSTQRLAHKAGRLEPARRDRLEGAGMVWDTFDEAWEEGFAHFVELDPDEEGRRFVQTRYEADDGFRLGVWQDNQRMLHKTGTLDAERYERLCKVGMVWDLHAAAWEEGFERYMRYETNDRGLRLVPRRHVTDDGFRLGEWQSNQRKAYKNGRLSEDRIERLEAAGILWGVLEAAMEEHFAALLVWPPNVRGHRLVPKGFVTDRGIKLGAWLQKQRLARRKAQLSAEWEARLSASGVLWDAKQAAWEEAFDMYEKLPRDTNGQLLVPLNATEGRGSLAAWVSEIKKQCDKGTLSAEQVKSLASFFPICHTPFFPTHRRHVSLRSSSDLSAWVPCRDRRAARAKTRRARMTSVRCDVDSCSGYRSLRPSHATMRQPTRCHMMKSRGTRFGGSGSGAGGSHCRVRRGRSSATASARSPYTLAPASTGCSGARRSTRRCTPPSSRSANWSRLSRKYCSCLPSPRSTASISRCHLSRGCYPRSSVRTSSATRMCRMPTLGGWAHPKGSPQRSRPQSRGLRSHGDLARARRFLH